MELEARELEASTYLAFRWFPCLDIVCISSLTHPALVDTIGNICNLHMQQTDYINYMCILSCTQNVACLSLFKVIRKQNKNHPMG